ncbi:hypothetical protein FHT72_006980 [Rhizobium sp. BK077]|nr:hypothetical protein [Rhizobium sp. BK112]MBB3372441.1 hypothetical protein [Rhizobium sp. BK077]MBB4183154.1 hypothetical protein [Rhizobium sp. BK109]
MDLSNPDVLRETITSMFNEQARRTFLNFRSIGPDVIEPLIAPGLRWRDGLENVDPQQLREAIAAVVEELNNPSRPSTTINPSTVQEAMDNSRCHYLWFC